MLMLSSLEEDGLESAPHHREAVIMALNDVGQQPIKVGAVLGGGSAVRRRSGKLAAELGAHFDGTRVVLPETEEHQGSGR